MKARSNAQKKVIEHLDWRIEYTIMNAIKNPTTFERNFDSASLHGALMMATATGAITYDESLVINKMMSNIIYKH